MVIRIYDSFKVNNTGIENVKDFETWDGVYYSGQLIDGEYVLDNVPPNIYVKAVFTDKVEIGWDEVPNADYYYIYYSENANGPWYYFVDKYEEKSPQHWVLEYSSALNGIGE